MSDIFIRLMMVHKQCREIGLKTGSCISGYPYMAPARASFEKHREDWSTSLDALSGGNYQCVLKWPLPSISMEKVRSSVLRWGTFREFCDVHSHTPWRQVLRRRAFTLVRCTESPRGNSFGVHWFHVREHFSTTEVHFRLSLHLNAA